MVLELKLSLSPFIYFHNTWLIKMIVLLLFPVAKHSQFLLFGKARPAMIKGISLTGKQRPQEVMIPVMDLSRPAALDYDVKTQYIYYSDVQR
jgi:hypothetical protein